MNRYRVCVAVAACVVGSVAAAGQLPDAPSAVKNEQPPTASHYAKNIRAGQQALRLTAGDKVVLGFRDAFSPTSMLVWTLAAGYEQILNNAPNYGTDNIAFAERVGAAFLRDSSDGMFTDAFFAPLFRQDPRYYKQGPEHKFAYRVVYAITRPLITRTDGGHSAPNLALLSGDFFGSWLTDAYYPAENQGFSENARTFGGSLGATALGNLLQEFEDDLFRLGHKGQQPAD